MSSLNFGEIQRIICMLKVKHPQIFVGGGGMEAAFPRAVIKGRQKLNVRKPNLEMLESP